MSLAGAGRRGTACHSERFFRDVVAEAVVVVDREVMALDGREHSQVVAGDSEARRAKAAVHC